MNDAERERFLRWLAALAFTNLRYCRLVRVSGAVAANDPS